MRKYTLLVFILFTESFGLTVGSNTAVTNYNNRVNFPTGVVNTILGFTSLTGGFSLQDSNTTCTYDAFFPVSGNVYLNSGKMYLAQDFTFGKSASLVNPGDVYGQYRYLKFPAQYDTLTLISTASVYNTTLNSVGSAAGDSDIYSVDWSYNDAYLSCATASSSPYNVRAYSFSGGNPSLVDSDDIGSGAYSSRWRPTANLHFAAAGWVDETYDDGRARTYSIESGPPLLTISTLDLENYVTRAVAWRPDASYLAIATDNTDGGSDDVRIYAINTSGAIGSRVAISPLGALPYYDCMDWGPAGNYLIVGAGTYIYLLYFNGSNSLTLKQNINIGQNVYSVDWSRTTSLIAVGLGGGTERLQVYQFNPSTETLTEQTSARIGMTTSVYGVHWSPDDRFLAMGSDATVAVYEYDSVNSVLNFVAQSGITGSVYAVRWSNGGNYLAAGGTDDTLRIFNLSTTYPTGSLVFSDTRLIFNSNVAFNRPVYFYGCCTLDGCNHILDLTSGSILLASNASLVVKDMAIKNLSGNKISCLDNTGTFTFQNVEMYLDSNYSFTLGHFIVGTGEILKMTGGYKFTYLSNQISRIMADGLLELDFGTTFSYNPVGGAKNLLAMENVTSKLCLNGGILHAADSGLELTNGTLLLGRKSFLSSTGTEGISIGDGTAVNNLTLIGDDDVELMAGTILKYRNVE